MTSPIRLTRFGLSAILVDCGTLQSALALHSYLSEHPFPGVLELIPAAQTVLVRCENFAASEAFRTGFTWNGDDASSASATTERVIDVVYNGEDLAEVAQLLNMSEEQVIEAHTGQQWSVAFAGFAPGFFYLHSENNVLQVPRRSSPRTAVPTGAVGLAGEFSGVYPRTSPGGWQLIGQTNAPLWDLQQDPPALLAPGNTVKFRAVREHIDLPSSATVQNTEAQYEPVLDVKAPGAQLLLQDSGRRGLTHWGVSPSGYADPVSARTANHLVGNPAEAVVLESLVGGFTLHARADVVLALTGAHAPAVLTEPDKEDRLVPANAPFALHAGQTLTVGIAQQGLRVYCAIRGGFAAEKQAKSRSFDTISGIGPQPLQVGDTLGIQHTVGAAVAYPAVPAELPDTENPTAIRVIPGPREDWFTEDSIENFYSLTWETTAESNRIGVRLKPRSEQNQHLTQPLERSTTDELPSEGMLSGAIQVPPNGEPVVFLADHPVTGGYPVIATVHPADLRLLAQAQPGTPISFIRFNPAKEATEQENTRA